MAFLPNSHQERLLQQSPQPRVSITLLKRQGFVPLAAVNISLWQMGQDGSIDSESFRPLGYTEH